MGVDRFPALSIAVTRRAPKWQASISPSPSIVASHLQINTVIILHPAGLSPSCPLLLLFWGYSRSGRRRGVSVVHIYCACRPEQQPLHHRIALESLGANTPIAESYMPPN